MDDISDKDLIRLYRDGDERAFEALVRRHLRSVYNFVVRFAGNALNADDIVQDAFVKAWNSLGRFDPEKSFKAWLFAIARNTAIDVLRKKKMPVVSDFETADDFTLAEKIPSEDIPLEDVLDKVRDRERIRTMLARLPNIYQSVLLMRYDEEMTFQDISDVLGESINTVKSRYRRAIAMLKESFEKDKKHKDYIKKI